ncbi:hypothetical protein NG796_25935 [Laspinema sp. A4]|nr:hypothetical protein [Laspinema sp. D2d]MCT7986719.1 hypothetical protein [Laspinema sp. D2d]
MLIASLAGIKLVGFDSGGKRSHAVGYRIAGIQPRLRQWRSHRTNRKG